MGWTGGQCWHLIAAMRPQGELLMDKSSTLRIFALLPSPREIVRIIYMKCAALYLAHSEVPESECSKGLVDIACERTKPRSKLELQRASKAAV